MADEDAGRQGLRKVTVNLTPPAFQALERAAALTYDNRTDVINRALITYGIVQDLIAHGGGALRIVGKDDEIHSLHLI